MEFHKKSFNSLGGDVDPNFGASEAYTHFATITKGINSQYNTPENPGLPLWIDVVMQSPKPETNDTFDHWVITPGSTNRVIMKMTYNSSPGDDGITYIILKICHPLIISYNSLLKDSS